MAEFLFITQGRLLSFLLFLEKRSSCYNLNKRQSWRLDMQIKVIPFALSLGIFWAVTLLAIGLASTYFNYATPFLELFSSLYIGLEPTLIGISKGAVMGFIDMSSTGFGLAVLYNGLCKLLYKECRKN